MQSQSVTPYGEGPSMQMWAWRALSGAVDARGEICEARAREVLAATPGYILPDGLTIEHALARLSRQHLIERANGIIKITQGERHETA